MTGVVVVKSHDRFREFAEFDVATRTIRHVYDADGEPYGVSRAGKFGTVGDERLVMWALEPGRPMLAFEGGPQLPLREAKVDWERLDEAGNTRLTVSSNAYRHEVRYRVPAIEGEPWDTYGIDLEDFDFGLFVVNIKNSPDRQDRFLEEWTRSY